MPERPDNELREASSHVWYEHYMMRRCTLALSEVVHTRIANQGKFNAELESFLVHVRNLCVFLGWHSSKPHPEDVLAKHYVRGWQPTAAPSWVSELYTAVSVTVSHLSYERLKRSTPVANGRSDR